MSNMFLKRDLEAEAKEAVPIGANSSSSKKFKMPKPPVTAPPPRMLVMSQQEANKASAGLKEQYTDAMVITVDAVDVTAAMLKGLKFKENMDLVQAVSRVQDYTGVLVSTGTGQCISNSLLHKMMAVNHLHHPCTSSLLFMTMGGLWQRSCLTYQVKWRGLPILLIGPTITNSIV